MSIQESFADDVYEVAAPPSFEALGVSREVIETLAKRDVVAPFQIQAMVMSDALAGRDVLAKSRTGSGKTLAFAIPIVERTDPSAPKPSALVLVPTRELAVQVAEETTDVARAKGLNVAAVFGGVSIREQASATSKAHILIATPGRLEDLANRKMIKLDKVRILVLDEADRMLDMGFQPQVDDIVDRLRGERQTMFFSATLDGDVGRIARAYTHDAALHEVVSPTQTVDEADHRFISVPATGKVEKLVEVLSEEGRGLALVFVRTKRGADRLVHRLKAKGVKALAMHGDLTQAARQKALRRFSTGEVDTLVATDVAARGLDLDDITHVINFDPPEDFKAYLHRVGRTARAGRGGTGITLVSPDQEFDMSRMASRLELKDEFTDAGLKISPPQLVYTSHKGGKSSLRPRPKRKF